MNVAIIKALAMTEVRLRMRRTSTLVALLAVMAISWTMIVDPAGGSSLMTVNHARVLYTSSALAIGSASFACILFAFGGFYLARGRIAEDIRSGTGSVIGATPVDSTTFLIGRWFGSVAYLGALVLAFMATILLLHVVRGDGPIEPHIYLFFYLVLLLPMVLFTASCATLFDSWAPLMGKGGDVLFFLLWAGQLGLVMPLVDAARGAVPLVELLDFNGMGAVMLGTIHGLHSSNVSVGGGDFNAALAPITLPNVLWSAELLGTRVVTAVLALAPLLLAVRVFHRFSPDKVKLSGSSKRRAPHTVLNQWLKPLSRLARPLFQLGAWVPGMAGQVIADIALTLVAAPSAVLALAASIVTALVVKQAVLAGVLLAAAIFWGILVCDLSTRDFGAGTEDMTGAVNGGVMGRYLRQYCATMVLGLLFTGAIALRWSATDPARALAVLAGIASLSALATMFGRCSRTSRLFMGLFLAWSYIALNGIRAPMLDIIGSGGVANAPSMLAWLAAGGAALAAGYVWNRRTG